MTGRTSMSKSSSSDVLLELRGIGRTYAGAGTPLTVLADLDLDIRAGEMVAVMGASGSGKSTLMNILGLLDQPTSGTYRIDGEAPHQLDADALAGMRRERFGFIFQHYQLLPNLSAAGNVETPAIYAGVSRHARRERAMRLLEQLGLAGRSHHRPSELSGGQQQRVSIARALMNGGQIILADEPTGALDSRSGENLLALFSALNAQGHTIIIVTHDAHVARHAHRIVEIKDGRIIDDRPNVPVRTVAPDGTPPSRLPTPLLAGSTPATGASGQRTRLIVERITQAFLLAVLSAAGHRLRTFLTMLGIIIGIASVVCAVALGTGFREHILRGISNFGTNTVDIYPGRLAGDQHQGAAHPLTLADVAALSQQQYVDSVTPFVSTNATVRFRNLSLNATVNGVGEAFFRVHGIVAATGKLFGPDEIATQSQGAVIDQKTSETLFGSDDPLGQIVLVGNAPVQIVGVTSKLPLGMGVGTGSLMLWMPYTSVMTRQTGKFDLQSATVRMKDGTPPDAARQSIVALLRSRHDGVQDFHTFSSDALSDLVGKTGTDLTLLVSSIALISLLVGGIGVMNIMLVSVAERVHEIGVRMAVGARRADIQSQFLIEAVLICLLGGVAGIVLAFGIGWGLAVSHSRYHMIFSATAVLVAFTSAALIGVVFGFMPARQAARLNPVDALARD